MIDTSKIEHAIKVLDETGDSHQKAFAAIVKNLEIIYEHIDKLDERVSTIESIKA